MDWLSLEERLYRVIRSGCMDFDVAEEVPGVEEEKGEARGGWKERGG